MPPLTIAVGSGGQGVDMGVDREGVSPGPGPEGRREKSRSYCASIRTAFRTDPQNQAKDQCPRTAKLMLETWSPPGCPIRLP